MITIDIDRQVFNDAYFPYLDDNTRYLHFYGSAGSGKSVFVAQKLILESFKRKEGQDTLVIRKIERTIKESVFKLLKSIIYQWKLQDYFDVLKSPAEITNKLTGNRFVFTGLDDPEKIKSISGIQKIWVEEATELEQNDFTELDRRLRGMKNHQIIFTYNPIDEQNWLKILFHNTEVENAKIIKTTYLDNKFVDEEYAKTLNRLREIDENQWRIYALGEWGSQSLARKFNLSRVLEIKPTEPIQIIDGVKIFRNPEKTLYSLAIDTSSGLGADFTAISLRSIDGRLFAQMKAKVGEDQTVAIALNLAKWYNTKGKVLIIPEVNYGTYVTKTIRDNYDNNLIYKRFIQDPSKQYDSLVPDFGFKTTGANRDLIINEFAYKFHHENLEILNEDEKKEMQNFIWNDKNKRYEAQEGSHDDVLFSDFICVAGFDYIRQYL